MPELPNTISSRLRAVIAKSGLTQEQFASKLGIPVERLRSLVYGKVKKLTQLEQRLLKVRFRVPAEFLAFGEGGVTKPVAPILPPGLTQRQQHLVHDILVGTALRDTAAVRTAIERFVEDEFSRPLRRARGTHRLAGPAQRPTSRRP